MAKIQRLEALIEALSEQFNGIIAACAVVSRLGQGDLLYETHLGGIDPTFLSTVISSVLLIGERLGHELNGHDVHYTLIDYGQCAALVVPCSEEVALLLVLKDSAGREAVIGAAREAARNIWELLGNKSAGLEM